MKKRIIPAVLILLAISVSLTGCFKFDIGDDNNDTIQTVITTEYIPAETTTYYTPVSTTESETESVSMPETVTNDLATTQQTEIVTIHIPTTMPEERTETTKQSKDEPETKAEIPSTTKSYSSYSKSEIIKLYSDALSKTRSYTQPITVHHKESFDGSVVECSPDISLAKTLANYIISAIADPSETDYSFSGGTATNEDGESIPLLLPQRTTFSLPENAVNAATVTENNGTLNIHIELISESVGFGEVPKYNSSAIGYLDTSQFDFKIITVNSCTITYSGSTIDAVIRPDGYISECTYVINMSTTGNVTGMGITGGGTIAGAQTEVWTLNW